jgi:hypothetical protein
LAAGAQAADPAQKPATAVAPAKTAPAAAAPKTYQFDQLGKIATWRPTGDHELYVKNEANEWYRVHLYEPCIKLFPGKTPTFQTETDENNVRSSAVQFEHSKCIVTDITKRDPPPQK